MENYIINILLVDGEVEVTDSIVQAFSKHEDRFYLRTVSNLDEAREQINTDPPHIIIADMNLPDGTGTDLIPPPGEGIRYPTIIMISHGDQQAASDVIHNGAMDYIVKSQDIFADMPHIAESTFRHCQLIDENKSTMSALMESEEKYRSIVENSLEGIYIIQDLTLVFCNQRFSEMFGFNDTETKFNKHLSEIVADDKWEMVKNRLDRQNKLDDDSKHFVFTACKSDGTKFEVETMNCNIVYKGEPAIQGVLRDISTNRQLEAELRQAQRMEAVGILAGGVSHDFNNLLTVISGHSQLLLLQLKKEDPFYSDIVEINESAKRATDLTRQLLAFSRKQTLQPKILNVNEIIENMKKMLGRIISEEITLENVLTEKLWKTTIDRGQLEQVIVNFAINSRDAMPYGGKLTITTDNVILDNEFTKCHPGAVQGEYVKISVTDTGHGMSEEIMAKVFEPFYTTKQIGKGTGLGLSMVYGFRLCL